MGGGVGGRDCWSWWGGDGGVWECFLCQPTDDCSLVIPHPGSPVTSATAAFMDIFMVFWHSLCLYVILSLSPTRSLTRSLTHRVIV